MRASSPLKARTTKEQSEVIAKTSFYETTSVPTQTREDFTKTAELIQFLSKSTDSSITFKVYN